MDGFVAKMTERGAFNGGARRAPMYSSIANLNTVPSDYELALQQQQEGYNMQADLDLFTNTQFFDFDMADMAPSQSPTAFNADELVLPSSAKPAPARGSMNLFNGEYQVHGYNPLLPHAQNAPPNQGQARLSHASTYPSNASSPSSTSITTPSSKARLDSTLADPNTSLEEASRIAAEEDKRRRNTAASARFRVKKKQREAALEKSAKDMTDRLSYLENRVQTLEMENKLLKDLITEKGGKEVDIEALTRRSGVKSETKSHDVKGVGTVEA